MVHAIQHKRPLNEAREVLIKLQGLHENLVVKHKECTKLIEDDSKHETEEQWLSKCQERASETMKKSLFHLVE